MLEDETTLLGLLAENFLFFFVLFVFISNVYLLFNQFTCNSLQRAFFVHFLRGC